jgi:uncharacterized membrane protein YcaP (DUF421 family)
VFLPLTIELLLGFVGLFIITKMLGKTQFSQVTPFDFISAIFLGEVVGSALYDGQTTVYPMLYSLFLWGSFMLAIKTAGQKSLKIRSWIDGSPSIVIRNGRIIRKELKKNRINIHDLLYMLRQSNVFSVREVEYAILEPNGSISVLKKADYGHVTRRDLNLPPKQVHLPTSLITDGEIIWDNLKAIGLDQQWLEGQILSFGIDKVQHVLYAEWKENEGIYIVPYA